MLFSKLFSIATLLSKLSKTISIYAFSFHILVEEVVGKGTGVSKGSCGERK
jgi:hypothetical protein